jgi:hypothetical protein
LVSLRLGVIEDENMDDEKVLEFLNAESNKYLKKNNSLYQDVLSFIPSRDKSNSLINWDLILSNLVSEIHAGGTISDRIDIINAYLKEPGINENDTFIEKIEDVKNSRIITRACSDENGRTLALSQKYITITGTSVVTDIRRVNNQINFLTAKIVKNGHSFVIKGNTEVLNDINADTEGLYSIPENYINVQNQEDSSLKITINKKLSQKISNNKIQFYIDGKTPDKEELEILNDDPEVLWHFPKTIEKNKPVIVESFTLGEALNNYPEKFEYNIDIEGIRSKIFQSEYTFSDINVQIYKNGIISLEMPFKLYDKVSGLEKDIDLVGLNLENACDIGLDFISLVGSIAVEKGLVTKVLSVSFIETAGFYFMAKDIIFLAKSFPVLAEQLVRSTRVMLLSSQSQSKENCGDFSCVIPGRKYFPLVFFRNVPFTSNIPFMNDYNKKSTNTFNLDMSYELFYLDYSQVAPSQTPPLCKVTKSPRSEYLGAIKTKTEHGYIVFFPTSIHFDKPGKDSISFKNSSFIEINGCNLTLDVDVKSKVDKSTNTTYVMDMNIPEIYTDFTHNIFQDTLNLDASSCVSPSKVVLGDSISNNSSKNENAITEYKWINNNEEIITGEKVNVPLSFFKSENGYTEITLKVRDSEGLRGKETKYLYIGTKNEITSEGKIPDTGQTKCYNDSGNEITCPSPGEEYYGQDGCYTINPPSYTKLDSNGNILPDSAQNWVMVKDNVTGLIWEVKTDDGSVHDKDNKYTWYNAKDVFIAELNGSNFGGYSDWRMPTVKELRSIVDYGRYAPAIDTNFFPDTMMSSYYWSSTTNSYYTGYAWHVSFYGGYDDFSNKSNTYYVRAVRGGQ